VSMGWNRRRTIINLWGNINWVREDGGLGFGGDGQEKPGVLGWSMDKHECEGFGQRSRFDIPGEMFVLRASIGGVKGATRVAFVEEGDSRKRAGLPGTDSNHLIAQYFRRWIKIMSGWEQRVVRW